MGCGSGGCGSGNGIPIRPAAEETGRTVFCVKFQKQMPGLKEVPFEGHPLGQRIYDHVSQQAWMEWIEYSKRIVNEFRLDLTSAIGQQVLLEQAEQFFFGTGGHNPPEFVAPKS